MSEHMMERVKEKVRELGKSFMTMARGRHEERMAENSDNKRCHRRHRAGCGLE